MASSERRKRTMGRHDQGRSPRLQKKRAASGVGQDRWILLAVAALSAVATALVLSVGAPKLPFRLNQRADREIRLTVDLQIPNETRTRNEQEEYVKRSYLVFLNNPQPILDLQSGVNQLLQAVAEHDEFSEFQSALRAEWKLDDESFHLLKDLLAKSGGLEKLNTKLDKVFEPLVDYGVLDDSSQLPSRDTKVVEIYPLGPGDLRLGSVDDLALSELKRYEGPFGKNIVAEFPDGETAKTLFGLIAPRIEPTLRLDEDRTLAEEQEARDMAGTRSDEYPEGSLVVKRGETIKEDQLRMLREEHRVRQAMTTWTDFGREFLGLLIVAAAVIAALGLYIQVYEPAVFDNLLRLGVMAVMIPATVGLARLWSIEPYHAEIFPIAVGTLLMAVAYNRSFALVCCIGISLLSAEIHSDAVHYFLILVGGTSVGVLVLDSVRSRTKLITVGVWSGLAYAVLSFAVGLTSIQPWTLILQDAAWRFVIGLVAGFLISGCLPFIETLFGIVTDISLIELSDTSHPLLRQLVQRAPGTYNHSVTVSIIAENAANRIGCNSLLVRVGAMFHDIGKMLKPNYFIENKSEDEKNRHNELAPAMSTLIIIGHVKDGVDLGRQHHLPQPIIDMIQQHHGTTLVDYFYQEAARGNDEDESVEEASFRYPGPRPRSKEAAVLMLADCVESASRALSEPTPARIEKLVNSLAMKRLLDGQFDESGLTLQEVRTIQDSLTKSLNAVYHGRIKYPAAG